MFPPIVPSAWPCVLVSSWQYMGSSTIFQCQGEDGVTGFCLVFKMTLETEFIGYPTLTSWVLVYFPFIFRLSKDNLASFL